MAKKWQDLSDGQRAAALTLMSVQQSLAVSGGRTWRPVPDQVNGSKAKWAAVIAVNFVGPVLYFTKGRRAVEG